MSSITLIILGFLMHKEKSAYEMVKEFETWNLQYWVKISSPSIYKNLVKLCEQGYLDSRVIREGEMPEKTIYSVNDNGKKYFYQLMEMSPENIGNMYFDFSAFIIYLHLLDKEKRDELLKKFSQQLDFRKGMMDKAAKSTDHYRPKDALLLIDFYQQLYDLLAKWGKNLSDNYNEL